MGWITRFSGWVILILFSFGVIVAVGPSTLHFFHKIEKAVLTPSAKLWVDEAAVVDPVMTFLDGGYWNYRCAVNPWVGCYGNGQLAWDVPAVRLVEKWKGPQWWRQGQVLQPEVQRWPWNLEFPRLGMILLAVRALAVALLAWFFFSLSWHSTGSVFSGVAVSATIIFSGYFTASWQGIKNDFTAALVLLWFLTAMLKLHEGMKSKSIFWWTWALLLGVWASMIRVSNSAVWVSVFGLSVLFFPGRWKRVTGVVLLSLFLLIVWNPNIRIVGSEIRWLSVFLSFLGENQTARVKNFDAEWGVARAVLIPLAFAGGLSFFNAWREFRAVWTRWCVLGVAAGISFYFVWRGAYQRTHYYLVPWLVGWYWLILEFRAWKGPARSWIVAFVLISLQWTPAAFPWKDLPRTSDQLHTAWMSVLDLDWRGNSTAPVVGTEWVPQDIVRRTVWLDINLRLAVPREWADKNTIRYFDSISEFPSDLVSQGLKKGDWVTAPCWGKSVEAWSWTTKLGCHQTRELEDGLLRSFLFVGALDRYRGVMAEEFLKKSPPALLRAYLPELKNSKINIREMKGSLSGAERWDGPYFFQKGFSLSREVVSQKPIREVLWTARSSLKDTSADLEFKLSVDGHPMVHQKISLDAKKEFCQVYTRSCRWLPASMLEKLQNWSEKYFVMTHGPLNVAIPSRKTIKIELMLVWPDGKSGVVNLDPIEFR